MENVPVTFNTESNQAWQTTPEGKLKNKFKLFNLPKDFDIRPEAAKVVKKLPS